MLNAVPTVYLQSPIRSFHRQPPTGSPLIHPVPQARWGGGGGAGEAEERDRRVGGDRVERREEEGGGDDREEVGQDLDQDDADASLARDPGGLVRDIRSVGGRTSQHAEGLRHGGTCGGVYWWRGRKRM